MQPHSSFTFSAGLYVICFKHITGAFCSYGPYTIAVLSAMVYVSVFKVGLRSNISNLLPSVPPCLLPFEIVMDHRRPSIIFWRPPLKLHT